MKKKRTIKQTIEFYVMSVAIILGALLTIIMIVSSFISTDKILLEDLQLIAKTSSQNVGANLHLLTDRMANLSQEQTLREEGSSVQEKQDVLDERETRIEFVWLGGDDLSGKKLYGNEEAPDNIADKKYYTYLQQTENIVIDEPYYENDIWQLCVALPMSREGEVVSYLVGSYKYDLLNDVLTNINIGVTGDSYIINEEGIIIADKNPENMQNHENIYELFNAGNELDARDRRPKERISGDVIFICVCLYYSCRIAVACSAVCDCQDGGQHFRLSVPGYRQAYLSVRGKS